MISAGIKKFKCKAFIADNGYSLIKKNNVAIGLFKPALTGMAQENNRYVTSI